MEPLASPSVKLDSVSVIFVIEDRIPDIPKIDSISAALDHSFADHEFIFVASHPGDETSLALKNLIAETPDSTCVFVGEHLDADQSRIVGIDHSIGDYVLLTSSMDLDQTALGAIAAAARQGFDLVLGQVHEPETRSRSNSILRTLFVSFLRRISGIEIESVPSMVRLMSRQTALYVLNQRHAELLLKSTGIGDGFPATRIPLNIDVNESARQRSASQSVFKGLRLMISSGSIMMRLASLTALTASGLALLYSLYVILIYVFKPDVAPGWTTVSLQVSGMMFLFSVIFALMAEYIVQIYENMPAGYRQVVTRELRSERTRRTSRLNVVDEQGRFQLGRPESLGDDNPPGIGRAADSE